MKVPKLLEDYMGWVNAGDIQFLQEPKQQKEVSKYINDLIEIIKDLEEKKGSFVTTRGGGKGTDGDSLSYVVSYETLEIVNY